MELGLFFMPLHRPEKPWAQSMEEDRQAIKLAERHGYAEAWVGEHFSTRAEPIPAPLLFLATLIGETSTIRFGTGVVNMGHRHPLVIAAEAAQFDQLSGGRLMLGVGPGGLNSDAELFGRPDMDERFVHAMESIDHVLAAWTGDGPFRFEGEHWQTSLTEQLWPGYGVGQLPKPLQQPHPPLAMAMVSPSGRTIDAIAERGFIPISANFVPIELVHSHWASYRAKRTELGLDADRSIWRVCRSILITRSDAEAEELLADPDGMFSFYFRYLRGVGQLARVHSEFDGYDLGQLNEALGVARMVQRCVIAGSADTVRDRLIEMVDYLGPFGTLVSTGHDWDGTDRWPRSIASLAEDVAPAVRQHMAALPTGS